MRYALADSLFYDSPTCRPRPRSRRLAVDGAGEWEGWEHLDDGHWVHWRPSGSRLPDQGWKVHVSTTPATAHATLQCVSAYCHGHGLAFKHLPDMDELLLRDAKDADRALAGKFMTIYPGDPSALRRALEGLDRLVGGMPGPQVLSDLRWREGPLYVRYGAFTRRWTQDADGRRVPALSDPVGTLVEDRRIASFTPPEWLPIPPFLEESYRQTRDISVPDGFGYRVTGVLHHSNAGGVYEAEDPAGHRVVLKEARPHAGLTPDGRDAVGRSLDEQHALDALAGPGIVEALGAFTVEGHRFLVLERVAGVPLTTGVVSRCPAIRAAPDAAPDADRGAYSAYRDWALGIAAQVADTIERIHAEGYVYGDLHPRNVVVTPGDRAVLVDFEMARPLSDASAHGPQTIGAPGFVAPDGRGGVGADLYALGCLELSLFCPLTALLALDPLTLGSMVDWSCAAFGLGAAWARRIRCLLDLEDPVGRSELARTADRAVRAWDTRDEDAVLELQVLMARSLESASDFSRADRAWPGDPQQFSEPGFSLAHGAAGVIHALSACRLDVDAQAVEWMDQAVDAETAEHAHPRPGLFDGLAGAAWLYRLHGHDDRADRLLERLAGVDVSRVGSDLYGGLAGLGLYLLSESEDDPALLDRAETIAAVLRGRRENRGHEGGARGPHRARTGRAGLMHGPSGTALFATRLFEHTGNPSHLRLALDAVEEDLGCCSHADDGSLQVDEGWRLVPYLASGSAGIGLVIAQLVPHLADPSRLLGALREITAAACAPFAIQSGLFEGRAGLIHYLVALSRLGLADARTEDALEAHVAALGLHGVRHRTGIAFPGNGLLRLSCDLATGSAGVLTALQAHTMLAHDESRAGWETLLPLVLPPAARSRQGPGRRHSGDLRPLAPGGR